MKKTLKNRWTSNPLIIIGFDFENENSIFKYKL